MTETAQTIKDSIEVLTPYLDQLAGKLGTTVDKLWMLQVKQAYIEGWSLLFGDVIFIVIQLLLLKYFSKIYTFMDELDNDGVRFIICIIGVIVALIIVFVDLRILCIDLSKLLTIFVNPEYYALQQLIYLIKGGM